MAIAFNQDLLREAVALTQRRDEMYEKLASDLKELHRDPSVTELLGIMPDGEIKICLQEGTTKAMVCIGEIVSETNGLGCVGTWFELLKPTDQPEQSSPDADGTLKWMPCECWEMLDALGVRNGPMAGITSLERTVQKSLEQIAQDIIKKLSDGSASEDLQSIEAKEPNKIDTLNYFRSAAIRFAQRFTETRKKAI